MIDNKAREKEIELNNIKKELASSMLRLNNKILKIMLSDSVSFEDVKLLDYTVDELSFKIMV